ncbi:MAG: RpiB/LacA/LacB family sugar-phosphate isomerase [Firmicutes bacterium]|nr:RpiB/LacA/LacB family sugar-phosphate isomerase [Bacillota bacterium]
MIYIGNDHGGTKLKFAVVKHLTKNKIEFVDLGAKDDTPGNHAEYAGSVVTEVLKSPGNKGILICGSGIGMSIAVNRKKGIRGALCSSVNVARLAREHNDANILVLAGRLTKEREAIKITDVFFNTGFLGGKYADRIKLYDK